MNAQELFEALCAPFPTAAEIDRFWQKVIPEPNSGCWLWLGATCTGGYGTAWIGKRGLRAHRVAFWLHNGRLRADLDIMHICDNPPCVNPDHLREGTTTDNMRDMWAKGRGNPPRGERNPKAKMTREKVSELRALAHAGVRTNALRLIYGIAPSQVRRIVRGTFWGGVS